MIIGAESDGAHEKRLNNNGRLQMMMMIIIRGREDAEDIVALRFEVVQVVVMLQELVNTVYRSSVCEWMVMIRFGRLMMDGLIENVHT